MESTYSTLKMIKRSLHICPPLPTGAPSEANLCTQQRPTSKEEGLINQADNFRRKETLKASADSWLIQLFPFSSECRDCLRMGNQHGTKPKPNCYSQNWDAFPRTLVPQRRRKNRKMTAGGRQKPLKENQQIGLHRTSSSIFSDNLTSTQMFDPVCRMKLIDTSPVRSLSEKTSFPFRKDFTVTDDSDSDLSEYDNEMISIFKALKQKHETAGVKSRQEAAQRVMNKIEELEGILHRVSVTSSEWGRGDSDMGDEGTQTSSRTLKKRPEFKSQSGEDRTLIVEELYDTLIQSLHQVLKMQGGNVETGDHLKPPSPPHHLTLAVLLSHSLSGRAEVSSPTLSESSSFDTLSPVLSSPLPPRPSVETDQTNAGTPDTNSIGNNSGNYSLIASEARGCKSATRTTRGAENERQEPLTWKHYLLSSGKNTLQRRKKQQCFH